jgi:hypothetical protein
MSLHRYALTQKFGFLIAIRDWSDYNQGKSAGSQEMPFVIGKTSGPYQLVDQLGLGEVKLNTK